MSSLDSSYLTITIISFKFFIIGGLSIITIRCKLAQQMGMMPSYVSLQIAEFSKRRNTELALKRLVRF